MQELLHKIIYCACKCFHDIQIVMFRAKSNYCFSSDYNLGQTQIFDPVLT